ncbi:diaminobutyrate acetyltransferase [Vibrio cincinnatiensis]|jgi:L-2,4-diaminobutyric acid acetyltransferase|uniref:L-2,4-diaminobutyric acid acetyltransferase n=1 Tax=Vibrio cincinnatiensis DSM 19608 TaxID=1123491 RepID=A0A1T4P0V8_VIBCI|nr:diaminobutyrate acetyltransferase [Vibrio cincinnatiensis]MCG3723478.1 diaminobutyrate acetyltransferase [Vibrio cincinnatiensis]SJZ84947.1 diaminobutyrate acetyltransferase [Vibrio cincinnatiensis DSM 19608]SUP05610.1 L-2,4-diaminobutyric acid acetyltransferase [Vibrio cincinnatiensis]
MWQTMMTASPWVAYPDIMQNTQDEWTFRTPNRTDGKRVHELIAQCSPLDENSAYCNFLQSTHFHNTCVVAERNEEMVGFVSAYRKPDKPNELFIWQVAVSKNARGMGLAFHMLNELLTRDDLRDITVLETTITRDNQGSWSLFKKLDRAHGERGEVSTFLDETRHFHGEHDTEYLYRIPLHSRTNQKG